MTRNYKHQDSPIRCACGREIEHCEGAHGEWMHSGDRRERGDDGHLAQPVRIPASSRVCHMDTGRGLLYGHPILWVIVACVNIGSCACFIWTHQVALAALYSVFSLGSIAFLRESLR